jgi:hypothetical protein
MNKINWEIIDNQMINIKYPLCFLNNLFKINNKFNDNQFIIILRFFLKHNYKFLVDYDLRIMLILLNKNKILTKRILKELYNLIEKKIVLTKNIIVWRDIYNKKTFWQLKIKEQIEELITLKMRFYSNFDVCKSNTFYFNKIYTLLKLNKNNIFHINELINRLSNIYELFGKDFFTKYKIIIIKKSKFISSTNETKIKYSKYIFQKINKILCKIIDSFILFNHIQNNINNILNPNPIDFTIDKFDSETDVDDILFMIKD